VLASRTACLWPRGISDTTVVVFTARQDTDGYHPPLHLVNGVYVGQGFYPCRAQACGKGPSAGDASVTRLVSRRRALALRVMTLICRRLPHGWTAASDMRGGGSKLPRIIRGAVHTQFAIVVLLLCDGRSLVTEGVFRPKASLGFRFASSAAGGAQLCPLIFFRLWRDIHVRCSRSFNVRQSRSPSGQGLRPCVGRGLWPRVGQGLKPCVSKRLKARGFVPFTLYRPQP
jgi:hypothetical protein